MSTDSRHDPPLSPSDLAATPHGTVRVAGRVLDRAPLLLGDAFQRTAVTFTAPPAELTLGAWLEVEGHWDGCAIVSARLTAEHGPCGTELCETTRFSRRAELLERRSAVLSWVRSWFARARYLEADTPTRVPGPNLDANIEPVPSGERWLITSPELQLKRLLVAGFPRVYRLGPCHRAEEWGPWHEGEFLMLEWYRAFSTWDWILGETERFVRELLETFSPGGTVTVKGHRVAYDAPFERLTVQEAFRRYAQIDDASQLAATDEERFFQLYVDEVEPALTSFPVPVFLIDYPISQAALARPRSDEPTVAERFELFLGGVELCNGYGELTDAVVQRARFLEENARRVAAGRPALPLDERFLEALREGMPPAAGNALGLDRLIAVALGAPNLQSCRWFGEEDL